MKQIAKTESIAAALNPEQAADILRDNIRYSSALWYGGLDISHHVGFHPNATPPNPAPLPYPPSDITVNTQTINGDYLTQMWGNEQNNYNTEFGPKIASGWTSYIKQTHSWTGEKGDVVQKFFEIPLKDIEDMHYDWEGGGCVCLDLSKNNVYLIELKNELVKTNEVAYKWDYTRNTSYVCLNNHSELFHIGGVFISGRNYYMPVSWSGGTRYPFTKASILAFKVSGADELQVIAALKVLCQKCTHEVIEEYWFHRCDDVCSDCYNFGIGYPWHAPF